MSSTTKSTILNDAMILNSISSKPGTAHSPKSNGKKGHSSPTFPEKLMALLDSREHEDSISWDPGGRSFTVHDAKTLMENVIPLYFKASSYPSFKRKLYRWGFAKQYSDDSNSLITPFYHKNFIRGKHALCREISCSETKEFKSSSKCEEEQDNNGRDSGISYPFAPSLGMNSFRNASNQRQRAFAPTVESSIPGTATYVQTNGGVLNNMRGIGPTLNKTSHSYSQEKTNSFPPSADMISSQFAFRRSINPMKEASLTIPNVEYEKARDLLKFQIRRQLYSNQRLLACLRSDTASNNAAWKSYQIAALQREQKMLIAQLQHYGS
jgi:hypothetical protein